MFQQKLEHLQYANAQEFHEDFRLMLNNCFKFNPKGDPINQSGKKLEKVFAEKWAALPDEPSPNGSTASEAPPPAPLTPVAKPQINEEQVPSFSGAAPTPATPHLEDLDDETLVDNRMQQLQQLSMAYSEKVGFFSIILK